MKNKVLVVYAVVLTVLSLGIITWEIASYPQQGELKREKDYYFRRYLEEKASSELWQNETLRLSSELEELKANPPVVVKEIPRYVYLNNTPVVTEIKPVATKDELVLVYDFIAYGMFSHRFYAENPWAQTSITGDVAFNQG